MLRSLQTLRDTSLDARILASDDDHLALLGGGDDYHTPWHWHDCLMIMLPRIGAVDFRDESRTASNWLSEAQFAVVPATLSHQTSARRGGHDHLAIYTSDDQLAAIEARLGSLSRIRAKLHVPTFFSTTPQMRVLLGLCQASDLTDRAAQSIRGHLVSALLIDCLAQIERGDPLAMPSAAAHGDALVSEVKAYIATNVSDALSLDHLAETFGLSRRHVTRLFRDKTGMSIGDYHDRERITRARALLGTTDLPVGEIAWRVGLDSGSALARLMRRAAGLSPSDVRRMARSDTH
ncbi:helix-turn-helix domain-containing protein [Tardiphaga alba]|uniref:Helix-turn-helix domain-containing protein n=1 Tax=Tardiphaga alba TaxID=340268 RepID=A0ABX8A9M6_9BRAD|nr:helix-turn-helix domain-containing protein [Tardiphaga alba]QUS40299.1 helix-turn-helix domain-containing protein [Tardiphaga alba]